LIAPTPDRMMRILTFSSDSFASVSASTSAEPCTSALTMNGTFTAILLFFARVFNRFEHAAREGHDQPHRLVRLLLREYSH